MSNNEQLQAEHLRGNQLHISEPVLELVTLVMLDIHNPQFHAENHDPGGDGGFGGLGLIGLLGSLGPLS